MVRRTPARNTPARRDNAGTLYGRLAVLPSRRAYRTDDAGPGAPLTRIVVDASIVSKWFMPEPYADDARRLATGHYEVLVPDLMFSELGTILQRRIYDREMNELEALAILQTLTRMPLQIHRTWSLAASALEIERRIKRAVYHCIHLALAVREGAIFVTADRRFYNAVQGKALASYVRWVEDVP